MPNYDETILRSRRVDRKAPFAPAHQALRIALYDEFAARAFFRKVIEAFGPREPFASCLKTAEAHVATLARLCRRHGVALPHDPFPVETALAPGWRANCERALAGMAAQLRLYQDLLTRTADAALRKAFVQLHTDLARQLPDVRDALAEAVRMERLHARGGIAPEEAHMQHGVIADFLEKTFSVLSSQHQAIGAVAPLLGRFHPATLAGFVAGGAGVLLARGKLNLTSNGKEG